MAVVNSIWEGMQGLAFSLAMTQSRRIEESVRAGENGYLTAIMQLIQGIQSFYFADLALQAAGRNAIAAPLRIVTLITPFAIALAKNYNLVSDKIRPVLNFIQNHISKVFEIAAFVSAIALIYFGHVVLGVTSLIVLALGILDRSGILPENIRQAVHRYTEPVLMVTGLFFGGVVNRLFALFNCVLWGARQYFAAQKKVEAPQEVIPENNVNALDAAMHLQGILGFAVNKKHIHCNALPPIPEIDIDVIVQQFDEMNWAPHMNAMREKLRRDARFLERHRNPDLKDDAELRAIVKVSLQTFIQSVKEHRILEGEPVDYTKLHNYLKVIAKYVQDQKDEITKADTLMRLAIDGGEYCGPGKFEATESIFAQAVSENGELSLKDKVLHCLQDERNRWFHAFYKKVMENNPVGRLTDWLDIHIYNQFINCYGDRFGLRKTAAENDEAAIVEPLLKFVVTALLGKGLETMFWGTHQPDHLIDALLPSIGTPQLPKPEIYAYFLGWIERQDYMTAQEKEELSQELADNHSLFNHPLETAQGGFNRRFLALMLYDMGVLVKEGNADAAVPTHEMVRQLVEPLRGLMRDGNLQGALGPNGLLQQLAARFRDGRPDQLPAALRV